MPHEDDNGWRTIESAPKHGFQFLAYWPKSAVYGVVAWDLDRFCWAEMEDLAEVSAPTHWQLLPEPPHDR